MTRRARHRLRIALLAIFGLLFQQAALASYLCPMERMPAESAVMAEQCAEMGMAQQQDNPALCVKRCAPDHSTSPDQAKLSVPALPTPALVPDWTRAQPELLRIERNYPVARGDPPSRLRFCTLLI